MNLSRPALPNQIRKFVQNIDRENPNPENMGRGQKGAMIGRLDKLTSGKADRYAVLGFLFADGNPLSSKELSSSQWFALAKWMSVSDDVLRTELLDVLNECDKKESHIIALLESYGGVVTATDFPEDDRPKPSVLPGRPIRRVGPNQPQRRYKKRDIDF